MRYPNDIHYGRKRCDELISVSIDWVLWWGGNINAVTLPSAENPCKLIFDEERNKARLRLSYLINAYIFRNVVNKGYHDARPVCPPEQFVSLLLAPSHRATTPFPTQPAPTTQHSSPPIPPKSPPQNPSRSNRSAYSPSATPHPSYFPRSSHQPSSHSRPPQQS